MAIKNVLIRCSLPLLQCRGQGYDGASVMIGHLTGGCYTVTEGGTKSPSSSLRLQDVAKSSKIYFKFDYRDNATYQILS